MSFQLSRSTVGTMLAEATFSETASGWQEVALASPVAPSHPIAAGVPQPIVVPHDEMYGEYFDIPQPDELVFISSFEGGEVFRSGFCYYRGAGRVVYFSPGDQEYPVYHQPEIQHVIANCVAWCGAATRSNDEPSARPGNSQRNWYM